MYMEGALIRQNLLKERFVLTELEVRYQGIFGRNQRSHTGNAEGGMTSI